MLATMAAVLGGFAFLVLRSYRRSRSSGAAFQPEGKRRWTDEPRS
jgi:hypothetical protein